MKIKYIILSILVLLIAFMAVLLPDREKSKELKPQQLLTEIIQQNRYISTDQIADRLVNEDPSLFLVDVRGFYDYDEFTLPGAQNVPLEEILLDDWAEYFEQPGIDVVLFSNSDIYADQAWILLKRKEYKDIYVMKGGINKWFQTIVNPVKPAATAPEEDFDLYQFRLGARQHFIGGGTLEMEEIKAEPITVQRKKKKVVAEGGC